MVRFDDVPIMFILRRIGFVDAIILLHVRFLKL